METGLAPGLLRSAAHPLRRSAAVRLGALDVSGVEAVLT